VICSASIIASLGVGTTTIAEGAVSLFGLYTISVILNTTICSVSKLCIVQGSLLLDLLFDDSKCVHLISPESRGFLIPFLQSFASQLHSGVDSFMVSTTSD